jgi:uncharacterized protein YlxW (UPF0749 family)
MMSGGQMMVVLIVAMVMLASIIKSRHQSRHRHHSGELEGGTAMDGAETAQLRDQVRQLKERLAVLERITIEKENSLEREIERLRDK